jgi:hypothetical protein
VTEPAVRGETRPDASGTAFDVRRSAFQNLSSRGVFAEWSLRCASQARYLVRCVAVGMPYQRYGHFYPSRRSEPVVVVRRDDESRDSGSRQPARRVFQRRTSGRLATAFSRQPGSGRDRHPPASSVAARSRSTSRLPSSLLSPGFKPGLRSGPMAMRSSSRTLSPTRASMRRISRF